MSGSAEGHERQCKARAHHTGEQCKRWALIGSNYCQFHGGRRGGVKTRGRGIRMPGFYNKVLGPTLKRRVEELLNVPRPEQMSLFDEIALARVNVERALQLASPVFEGTITDPNIVALSLSCVRDAVDHVANLIKTMSTIEKDTLDKISIYTLNLFIIQICRAIKDELGDDPALAERIGKAIDERVRLPLDDRRSLDSNVTGFIGSDAGAIIDEMDKVTSSSRATEVVE
jgi:hypothetical protein